MEARLPAGLRAFVAFAAREIGVTMLAQLAEVALRRRSKGNHCLPAFFVLGFRAFRGRINVKWLCIYLSPQCLHSSVVSPVCASVLNGISDLHTHNGRWLMSWQPVWIFLCAAQPQVIVRVRISNSFMRSPDVIQLPSAVCALPVPLPLLVSRRIVAVAFAESPVVRVNATQIGNWSGWQRGTWQEWAPTSRSGRLCPALSRRSDIGFPQGIGW